MNIDVVARIRPPSRGEIAALNVSGTRIETSGRIGHIFDAVYKPHVLTYDIYKDSFASLVDFFVAGYNVCALVFGETDSGKSYSLAGEKTVKAGIIPLLINGVFLKLKELNKTGENRVQVNRAVEGQVTARCFQVYNETIKDLLSPIHEERKLHLQDDPVQGTEITNITTKQVLDSAECTALFRQAMECITCSQTDYGQAETRSAILFTLDLLKVHKDTPEPFNSRLMVIKLPGAEKLAEDPTQLRMREGPTLNRSILAFRKVVSSLASSRSATRVINYSDSKLTMLLKDALGGNCKTKVLITLKSVETPALGSILTTAGQLAQILNYPIMNDHLAQKLISQYRATVLSLQNDLKHSGLKPGDAQDSKFQEMKDQLAKIANENAKLLEGREQLYRRIIELEAKYTEATSSWKQLSSKLELSDEEKLQIYKNLVDLQLENNKILEEAAADKYELTNRILSLENQVSELDSLSERDRRAAEQANKALDQLQSEHKELTDEYLVLKTNHIELSNDYQKEVSKNEELGLELVHLSNVKERLQKDKEEVEIETMQEYYSQLRKLASKFSHSSLQEKNDMSKSLVSLRSENLQLEKQLLMSNSAKEGVIDTLKGQHRKELTKLEDSINTLKMNIKQLQDSQRKSQRKLAGQSAELITSQADKRRLEEQNDKLDQQLKEISVEYSNRLQQYIHDISVYCGQLSGQQVSLESLQAYIDAMVRKVRDAQEHRVLTLEERVSALKNNLREMTRKHSKLLSVYSVLRYDLESSKVSFTLDDGGSLYQPSQEELDSAQSQEIRKLTEKIHKYEQDIEELENKLSDAKTKTTNVSIVTTESKRQHAFDGPTEGNWSHLRKLMREFTLNTQQDLENERASLMTRCIVAEEQVVSLQEYIDTHLKRYFEEIAKLRRRLGESERVNSADGALTSNNYGRIGDKKWMR